MTWKEPVKSQTAFQSKRDYTGIRGYEIKGETDEPKPNQTTAAAVHSTNAGKF